MNHIKNLFLNTTNYQTFHSVINNSNMDIQIKDEIKPFKYTIHKMCVPLHLKILNYNNEIEITYNDIREMLTPFFGSTEAFEKAIIQQLKSYIHSMENMDNINEQAKINHHNFSELSQMSNLLQLLYSRIYLIEHTMSFLEENSDDMDIIFSDVKRNYIYCLNHRFKTINELNVFVQMYWSNCMSSMKKHYNFHFFQEELRELSLRGN